ncbi:MAG: hypothetical protein WCT12_21740, partial [Verrucomicrobiota bacterium]
RLLQVRDRKAQVTFGRGQGALYHVMNRSDRREDIVQADSSATNIYVVVEACTSLANHAWSPVRRVSARSS